MTEQLPLSNPSIQLLRGDCIELMKTLPDNSIDMVLTDPPYGTTACKWDSIIDLPDMWLGINRVLKPSGAAVLFAQTPFDKVLGVSNIKNLRYEIIWEKTSATGHLNAKRMPMKAHENILVFYKKLPTYNPQKTTGHAKKESKTGVVHLSECYGEEKRKPFYSSTDRYPRSVQLFPTDKQTLSLHPTQKPVALMEYLIKTYTNEGETVLDFTMGSGTTGVAAKNLNRSFIGIELDQSYFKTAFNRIQGVSF